MNQEHSVPMSFEPWAGVESTRNRVGDTYFCQIERSGHARRVADLELIATLGVRRLRYPILWERTAPEHPEEQSWSWADDRLNRLRQLGIGVIAGFLHHGSGPRYTSLVDARFAPLLADYAAAVARRYPWLDHYTPVNEPLTTARFSGLYGHWYPHRRDDGSFIRALIYQCRATVLAMRAVRRENPQAKLVQTEDVGRARSTPRLTYQAEFENVRRWLSFDLLSGKVDRNHPLWGYLHAALPSAELNEHDIRWFTENPCPPDILGINYYVTSERFLDDRLALYPDALHGGNGRHAYVDTEAVRVCPDGLFGLQALLLETWERYRTPVAITEIHLGCTRDEQIRWLVEMWNAARRAQHSGVDVRAATAWAVFGSYNWDSLVTRDTGYYEPGLFDVRGSEPRATALAHVFRKLAAGEQPQHPVLDTLGWWHRAERLLHAPVPRQAEAA